MRLYGFGAAFGVADASPFVLKVEAFLRWQGLSYDKVSDMGAVRRSANRKLPMLEDDGTFISDSQAIIDHVVRTRGLVVDADLTEDQLREAYWVTQTLEKHVYFAFAWMRWWPDDTWPQVQAALFDGMPRPLRGVMASMVRRGVKKQLWAQGVARYPEPQIAALLDQCFEQVSARLADRPFWFGDELHTLDCQLYAFLAPLWIGTFKSSHMPDTQQYPRLRDYAQRMHERLGFASGV